MSRALLAALLGHWRRHPVELATLLVGLAVATALWSGVQALNAEARASYAAAQSLLGGGTVARIEATDGQDFPLADYVALRRAGWKVSPVLEGDLRRGETSLRLIGIDPLTLPPRTAGPATPDLMGFLLPPHRALAAPETVARLAQIPDLPPRTAAPDLPPDTLMLDIGAAETLLGAPNRVSHLLVPATETRPLPPTLATHLRIVPPTARSDIARLTDSFHLNLTAFGFLSFVVGLFIVYSAIGLAFEQRRPMLRTLRACGVSASALTLALVAELAALALIGGAAGVVAGYGIAAALLPDVAASLRGLYGAHVPGSLSLAPSWWLAGLGIALLGALAAAASSLWRAFTLPLLATAQPQAWRAAAERGQRRQCAAAALCAAGALAALVLGHGLVAGFAVMGGLMLAAALLLPAVLSLLLRLAGRGARGPIGEWLWADARQQLGGLSLALMALLLALGVNVGVGTMVDSFRLAFLGWLDQRLAAEVYVAGTDAAQASAIATWLAARPDVTAVLPIASARSRVGDAPLEIMGFRDDPTYRDHWPLIETAADAWDAVAAGRAALVSEQLARRDALDLGSALTVPTPTGPWTIPVAGIYSDYGNPEGAMMVALSAFGQRWPAAKPQRLAIRVPPERAPALIADLRQAFALPADQIRDQRGIKDLSKRIFEKTFAVTVALNALTLAVAGIALLTSLLTLSNLRLAQLAPLWALGLTRRQLAAIEFGKALLLAGLTALAALPLGLAVAWVLTAVINVQAFGWRLPVFLFPGKWLTLLLLALATAAVAALWPAWRLRRAAPLTLLGSFSNER